MNWSPFLSKSREMLRPTVLAAILLSLPASQSMVNSKSPPLLPLHSSGICFQSLTGKVGGGPMLISVAKRTQGISSCSSAPRCRKGLAGVSHMTSTIVRDAPTTSTPLEVKKNYALGAISWRPTYEATYLDDPPRTSPQDPDSVDDYWLDDRVPLLHKSSPGNRLLELLNKAMYLVPALVLTYMAIHGLYMCSLFSLAMSYCGKFTASSCIKALKFAKLDLATGMAGTRLSHLLFQPRFTLIVDVRAIGAMVLAPFLSDKVNAMCDKGLKFLGSHGFKE